MKKIFLLFLLLNFVAACQSTKDALTLQKKNSGDEFLVEKKSPLVLPPDYGELPEPGEVTNRIKKNIDEDDDILVTLSNGETLDENQTKDSKPTSIEESVLEKIE